MATETWWIDGWELTAGDRGWEVRDGTDEWAGMSGNDVTLPGRDGTIWRRRNNNPGTLRLSLWLKGADAGEVREQWAKVLRAVGRRNRTVRVRRRLPNGSSISCAATLTGTASPVHLGQRGVRAQLTFTVPDGRWVGASIYSRSTTPGVSGVLSLPDLADSTAPLLLTYEVTGPATSFVIEDMTDPNATSSERSRFTYYGTVAAGEKVTVSPETWKFTSTGANAPDPQLTRYTGRRWIELEPPLPDGEPPKVDFSFTGGSSATKLTVTGRCSYLV